MNDVVCATFNIRTGVALDGRHSWPFRKGATARAIQALDADIVGLQEVHRFQQRYLQRSAGGFAWLGEGRSGRGRSERCPVLVRESRFEVVASDTRWFGGVRGARLPRASHPRIATVVRARDRATGTDFDVFNTHLDEHREENRLRSVEDLLGWIHPDRPTIVVGDMNAVVSDPTVTVLRDSGLEPVEPENHLGTAHEFSGTTNGRRIDHILVSLHWAVQMATVMECATRPFPSDHWPLVARLRLRRAA